jgi:hypothetical protein
MLGVNWKLRMQEMRPLAAPILVVAVSALLALLFTFATRPAAEPPHAAGEARVRLVQDEHALVADLVRSIQDEAEAERLAAARSRAEMQALVLAEASRQAPAVIVQLGKAAPVRVALPLPKPDVAAGPPLQLQVATVPSAPPEKPVVTRALSTDQRIPGWFLAGVENVADWAIAAPSRVISQLPERRFL